MILTETIHSMYSQEIVAKCIFNDIKQQTFSEWEEVTGIS
jgi:hypothetical protein